MRVIALCLIIIGVAMCFHPYAEIYLEKKFSQPLYQGPTTQERVDRAYQMLDDFKHRIELLEEKIQ